MLALGVGSEEDVLQGDGWILRVLRFGSLRAPEIRLVGDATGSFVNASRYSFTSPPDGLDHAAQVTMGAGAKGLRISYVVAGGDMTGHLIGAMFLDSLDGLVDILATVSSDAQFLANAQAAGGKLEARTIFRMI